MQQEILLEVQDLSVELLATPSQASKTLIQPISFNIKKGEVFALVGGSGSGKSITSLALMRLLPSALHITGGQVLLSGQDIFAYNELQMNSVRGKQIAMVFQEPQSALNPVQSIGQQVAESLREHQKLQGAELKRKVLSLLEEVGIPEPEQRYDWYPHQLSGGQKQRVVIAIALACEPMLLVADEPTTALDVTIQKQILSLLDDIRRRRQLAILLITHDMGVVAEMADRVAVMQKGAIVEQALVKDFFASPQHPYSQELLAFLPKGNEFCQPVTEDALLELKDIKVWFPQRKGLLQRVYDHTKAVDGVSLSIAPGETLALVGESGSGKTTVGRAILRLEDISAGEVYFAGQRIDVLNKNKFLPLRKKIQIIFQDPFSSMNPRFSVREILEEGMKSLGVGINASERETRMQQLLEKVGLHAGHLDRFPHEFSGGQRQRIAIARALAVEPDLIICDEPTSALDLSIRGQVLDLLQELQREFGIAYLLITHDLSIIPKVAHRVAVMKEGCIVEQGSSQQIMENPQNEYTQSLLASVPSLLSKVSDEELF